MKRRKVFSNKMIIVLFIALFLFSYGLETKTATSPSNNCQITKLFDHVLEKSFSFDLTPHEHININSDSDFISYRFPGSGTEIDPYIIENYEIISSIDNGISIKDTTKFFLIQNCYIANKISNTDKNGVYISNVAEGTASIINNTCNNNYRGISLISSSGSTLTNNTCTNYNYGICLSSSSGCALTNNTCSNNKYEGIRLSNSSGSTLTNNTCTNNGKGIYLLETSSATLINNTCNNNDDGIYLVETSSATLINNTCNNNYYGIFLEFSDSCIITYNLLQENREHGICLYSDCDNNVIHHNTFVDNILGGGYYEGSSQAYDQGRKNTWYDPKVKEGNYWSNLESDCTYKIDGDAHSKDLYPLNRAQSCPNPITMTILSIVLPLLVGIAILAFVVPKYVIPYFRNRKTERHLRKLLIPDLWFSALLASSIGLAIGIFLCTNMYSAIIGFPLAVSCGVLLLISIQMLIVSTGRKRKDKEIVENE